MNKTKIIEMIEKRMETEKDDIWEDQNYIEKYWEDLSNEFKGASEDEVIEFLDSLDDDHLKYIYDICEELYAIFYGNESFDKKMTELQARRKVDIGWHLALTM